MAVEIVKVWHYKAGYDVHYEKVGGYSAGDGPSFVMRSAYTPDGAYIGDPKMARLLIVKRGIKPELADPSHRVCSIGFCEQEQKWYGWSHRAICGFGIGDMLFEEKIADSLPSDTLFVKCGAQVIETLDQAKQAAINFAEWVS